MRKTEETRGRATDDLLPLQDMVDIGDLGNELDEPDDLSETAREAERRLNADAWDD